MVEVAVRVELELEEAKVQVKATGQTITNMDQLLDYLATKPDATMWYSASDMILNIYLDALNLLERNTRSRIAHHFFSEMAPKKRWTNQA